MASAQASTILDQLAEAGKAFKQDEPGSREALIAHSRALVAALEIPSEFIQRTFWAEVRQYHSNHVPPSTKYCILTPLIQSPLNQQQSA